MGQVTITRPSDLSGSLGRRIPHFIRAQPMNLKIRAILSIGLFGMCAALAQAQAAREFVLGNGMKVVVKEDRRAPTAVQMVWYKVGSMDEVNGTTGISHALEHMMFK